MTKIKELKRRLSLALRVMQGKPTGYRLALLGELDWSSHASVMLVECRVTGRAVAEGEVPVPRELLREVLRDAELNIDAARYGGYLLHDYDNDLDQERARIEELRRAARMEENQ